MGGGVGGGDVGDGDVGVVSDVTGSCVAGDVGGGCKREWYVLGVWWLDSSRPLTGGFTLNYDYLCF